MKNRIFHTRDLCLRALGTNSKCAKSVRRNGDIMKQKEKATILDYETVALSENDRSVIIIDQTVLPGQTKLIELRSAKEIWDAIYLLQVRGAPAIGVAAAMGIYVLARDIAGETGEDYESFYREFTEKKEYLNSARPTAVNPTA